MGKAKKTFSKVFGGKTYNSQAAYDQAVREENARQAKLAETRRQNKEADMAMQEDLRNMDSSGMNNDGMGGTLLTGNEGTMVTQEQKKKKTMLSGDE